MTLAHIEKILLLFNNLELNGSRDDRENRILRQVAASLTPQRMEALANRHHLAPLYPDPWQKRLLAGSDDHSALNIARSYTLLITGDGPCLSEMKATMSDLPCTFTGYLRGEALATIYASCDIFVFPSTTDTFGNVVLEAQASGLPVIVTDQGGPCENIISAGTGLVVAGNDIPALLQALQTLVQNRPLARQMGRQARAYMRRCSFEAAFMET